MKSYLFANELEHVAFCVIHSAGHLDKTNLSLPISLSICQHLSFISDRMGICKNFLAQYCRIV